MGIDWEGVGRPPRERTLVRSTLTGLKTMGVQDMMDWSGLDGEEGGDPCLVIKPAGASASLIGDVDLLPATPTSPSWHGIAGLTMLGVVVGTGEAATREEVAGTRVMAGVGLQGN